MTSFLFLVLLSTLSAASPTDSEALHSFVLPFVSRLYYGERSRGQNEMENSLLSFEVIALILTIMMIHKSLIMLYHRSDEYNTKSINNNKYTIVRNEPKHIIRTHLSIRLQVTFLFYYYLNLYFPGLRLFYKSYVL